MLLNGEKAQSFFLLSYLGLVNIMTMGWMTARMVGWTDRQMAPWFHLSVYSALVLLLLSANAQLGSTSLFISFSSMGATSYIYNYNFRYS